MTRPLLLMLYMMTASGVAFTADEATPADTAFQMADQNDDGRLSMDEARQDEEITRHFRVWDSDQNGQLDAGELRAGREAEQDSQRQRVFSNFTVIETESGAGLQRFDADGDGRVTRDEWAASGTSLNFANHDMNGDGFLDDAEWYESRTSTTNTARENEDAVDPQGIESQSVDTGDRRVQMMGDNLRAGVSFSAYDTDGNGMLDRGEAADNAYITSNFDTWDTDNNDRLDPDEAELGRLDVNR